METPIPVSPKNSKQNLTRCERIEIAKTTDIESLIELFGVVFEQVKLQQEVRDRWFEHYISIIGAISALSAICFGYYSDIVDESTLLMILSVVFLFAGIVGIMFYILYIKQRLNYLKEYKEIKIITNIIYSRLLTSGERRNMQTQFKKHRRGADFVTLLIENFICSTCIGLSTLFASLSFGWSMFYSVLVFIIVLALFILSLLKLSSHMEEVL